MARRVTWRIQHHDGAVAEYVLVPREWLHFAPTADPVREWRGVDGPRRLGVGEDVPVSFTNEQSCLRKGAHLSGVVAVIMTDADVLHVIGRELELREQVHEARLRCGGRVPDRVPRVPHEIVVTVANQVAADGQLYLEAVVRIRIGESTHVGGGGVRAAVQARQRDRDWRLSERVRHAELAEERGDRERREGESHDGPWAEDGGAPGEVTAIGEGIIQPSAARIVSSRALSLAR